MRMRPRLLRIRARCGAVTTASLHPGRLVRRRRLQRPGTRVRRRQPLHGRRMRPEFGMRAQHQHARLQRRQCLYGQGRLADRPVHGRRAQGLHARRRLRGGCVQGRSGSQLRRRQSVHDRHLRHQAGLRGAEQHRRLRRWQRLHGQRQLLGWQLRLGHQPVRLQLRRRLRGPGRWQCLQRQALLRQGAAAVQVQGQPDHHRQLRCDAGHLLRAEHLQHRHGSLRQQGHQRGQDL